MKADTTPTWDKYSQKMYSHLFHGAGGAPVPFGPHELDRRRPLTENGVRQNIQPVDFNQNCGVTQPGDPQTWSRL